MDTSSNIKIVAEDGVLVERSKETNMRSYREALLRVWVWIERVESMCSASEDIWAVDGDASLSWPSKGLIDAGAWQVLRADDGVTVDEEVFSEPLCCVTYDSPGRR